jgi:CubicO group peptidase (beta-lactamase class C family)
VKIKIEPVLICVVLATLTSALADTSFAQTLSKEKIARIDAAVNSAMAATETPSISIAIVAEGKVVYARGYGWARPGVPATANARYGIGSNTKAFTTAALLVVSQQKGFSLDEKVSHFLPTPTRAKEVTLQQILSHTSGYRDMWPQDFSFAATETAVTPQGIIETWAREPLDFEPGTRWQYSNTGFVIAGLIVEQAVNEPLFTFMQQIIFKPLGIKPELVNTPPAASDPLGYQRFAMGPVREVPEPAAGWLYAAGDLKMSASDLARWDISIINRSLFSSGIYKAMETETLLKNGAGTGYGLGLYVKIDNGRRVLRHGGEVPGFLSENRIYPDDSSAIVVLENAEFGDAHKKVADAIENILFEYSGHVGLVRSLISDLRAGQIPKSKFTGNGKYYFNQAALSDYHTSLLMIGDLVDLHLRTISRRGRFDVEIYDAEFRHQKAKITLLLDTSGAHGIEQFILTPRS